MLSTARFVLDGDNLFRIVELINTRVYAGAAVNVNGQPAKVRWGSSPAHGYRTGFLSVRHHTGEVWYGAGTEIVVEVS